MRKKARNTKSFIDILSAILVDIIDTYDKDNYKGIDNCGPSKGERVYWIEEAFHYRAHDEGAIEYELENGYVALPESDFMSTYAPEENSAAVFVQNLDNVKNAHFFLIVPTLPFPIELQKLVFFKCLYPRC